MGKQVEVPGRGIVEFPDSMNDAQIVVAIQNLTGGGVKPSASEVPAPAGMSIDDEIADWQKYGRRGVEHKDMPTIARLPFTELWGKDIPASSSAALMATLMTDNPDARQQIALKHLPGAKGSEDRYGNPIIEYKGEKYYMSRPGEIDATDVAKAGGAVAASVPAMMTAPVSLPLAMGAGAVTAGAYSLAGDAATRAAGGTAQQYDLGKAGISAIINGILPLPIAKVVLPFAGELNTLLRSGRTLTDDALKAVGIDPSILTPELRQAVTKAYSQSFGDTQAVGGAYRQGLGTEFDVPLTKGEISQSAPQMRTEQGLSGPGDAVAERTMRDFRTGPDGTGGQNAQLNQAQEALQARAGGGVAITPDQAGEVLKRSYSAADKKAKEATDLLYDKARNPFLLMEQDLPVAAPGSRVADLGTVVKQGVAGNDAARVALTEEGTKLTPNAVAALKSVEDFSAGSRGPRVAPPRPGGPEHPSMVSSPELTIYNPRGLLEPTPPGATNTRVAIDQPGTVTHFPAQQPSAESLLASGVNAPAPGGPRITGPSPTGMSNVPGEVNWTKVIDQRKILTDFQQAAVREGNKTDQAAVAQIIKDFDAQFAPLNPNLSPGREAHAERMATFSGGGSKTQDRMTEAALDVLAGPEGGAKVVNTILGPGVKRGEATQMIDHLNSKVFVDHPEARDVLRGQMLRRLMEDENGKALTPRETVTAIEKAFGDAQSPIYQRVFSGEQLAELRRFKDLQEAIAKGRESPNPSKSGLFLQGILKLGSDKASGAVVGGLLGSAVGFPGYGAAAGAAVGQGVGTYIPRIQAASAIKPGPRYMPPGPQGARALPPSLLAAPPATTASVDELHQPQGGPADRIMNSLMLGGR